MVQLQILSGRRAGAKFDSAGCPVTIGRAEKSDFFLDEPGVFPTHCRICCKGPEIFLELEPEALASVNGTVTPGLALHNGDLITLGSVTLRFALSAVKQSSLGLREAVTWVGLALICLAQVAVIYLLCR